jgi:hypothetical protein
MSVGDAERCGCLYCLNFIAQRSSVYPDEFRTLLKQLGIDAEKEGEVYESGPEGDFRVYGGWFYLAGEVDNYGERNSTGTGAFEYWFADVKRLPKPAADFGDKVAVVEFITKLPWLLAEQSEPA